MKWTWIVTVLSIIGVIANVKKKRWCFFIWVITNTTWMLVNIYMKLYSASFMFFIYLLLAIWGIISWGKKGGGNAV